MSFHNLPSENFTARQAIGGWWVPKSTAPIVQRWQVVGYCHPLLLLCPLPPGPASMCAGHPGLIALCLFRFPSEVCTPTLHRYYSHRGCSQCLIVCSCLCPSFALSSLLTPVLPLSCLSCSLPYACPQMSQCMELSDMFVYSAGSPLLNCSSPT